MKLGRIHFSKLVLLQLVLAVIQLYIALEERRIRKEQERREAE